MPSPSLSPVAPLKIEGGLDIQSAERLRPTLLERLDSPAPCVLDLSGVSNCDTAGLQVLYAARRSATASGREWQVTNPPPAVLKACEEIGLSVKELGL